MASEYKIFTGEVIDGRLWMVDGGCRGWVGGAGGRASFGGERWSVLWVSASRLKKSSGGSGVLGFVGFGKEQLGASVLGPQEINPGPLEPGLKLESGARTGTELFPGTWVLDFGY